MARLRPVLLFVLQLALLLLCSSHIMARQTTSRVEVPIYQRVLSDGDVRYFVNVRIGGGQPVAAMLDTGSFGLRVLASALAPAQYQPSDIVRRFFFGSGVVYTGELAKAEVAIGDASTGAPVIIQVIGSVACAPRRPFCPAARLDPSRYRIGGDGLPGEGFSAILGLSLRAPAVPNAALNPLMSFGNRKWIVKLPLPGQTAPGTLVVNPTEADLREFRLIRLQSAPAWNEAGGGRPRLIDGVIPGCLDTAAQEPETCPPVKLDTGSAIGLQPFYSYIVMYDANEGVIGLKPRADAAAR